jgi:DNA-directed RNA polymerase specialized sigma24 family protein
VGDRGEHERTPLERALQSDPDLSETLFEWARARTRHKEDAEDVVGTTLRRALQRERTAQRWDPGGEVTALAYLAAIQSGVLSDRRRLARRRPSTPVEDPDAAQSTTLDPEQVLLERGQEEERRRITAELCEKLAAETNGKIPLAMMDAAEQGIQGHARLAEHIGCTIEQIRAAQRRITYHARRLLKMTEEGEVA